MASLVAYLVLIAAGLMWLGIKRAPLWAWAAAFGLATYGFQAGIMSGELHAVSPGLFGWLAWIAVGAVALLSVPPLRRRVVIEPAFDMVRRILPRVSDTEQQALDAGTVGYDAELFSGTPDWDKLRSVPPVQLTAEEQAFLDGPTEELCRIIDEWNVRHTQGAIPTEIWDFVKAKGFLGMLISKEHGGLGFSGQAQSIILGKVASRSADVATIVMVPNSLGPGELIEKYGTPEQKEHFLPRLAQGLEVPCFSLTGPTSGSDAASMRDIGYVTRGVHDGKEVLGIRLSWDKRYITLGPVATQVGLAFRLFDPENHLGHGEDVGITVALIPADHPGVQIGRRHLPMGAAFPNGPNTGRDVFIPFAWVIGGERMAGQGWRMLMECLAAGRAISLPSSATAGVKAMLRVTSAYARVRRQFGFPISRMEGIEEALARMVESAYVAEAARGVTAAMVSRGERPSVLSALMKYQTTERLRQSVNDAFDIHGGRAICDGPSNYLQSAYRMVPVGITVEGANILTRTLITFAQGALRSHPYLMAEIRAVQDKDKSAGLAAFESAFCGHIAFSVSNFAGALFHNLTLGWFAKAPEGIRALENEYRQISRASRSFALLADLTVALLGGGLKVKQRITGRLADALSELYLMSCALKRFEDEGSRFEDRALVELAVKNGLHRFETALQGVIENFPNMALRPILSFIVFPYGRRAKPASDELASRVVRAAIEPGELRDRLTQHIFITRSLDEPTGVLEVAFEKVVQLEAAEKKLEAAIKKGVVRRFHGLDWISAAADQGVITESEAIDLKELEQLTARVIAVDHFDPAELRRTFGDAPQPANGVMQKRPLRTAAE